MALPPPFIEIQGLSNFRDIGGYPLTSTSTVRKGIFYRGPDTSSVTAAGLARLRELHVTTDFDLRSQGQIEKAGGATCLEGVTRVWSPAFPDGEYSPAKAAERYVQYSSDGTEGIVQAFTDILIHGAPACRAILLHIISLASSIEAGTSQEAFYIHCTTGNNRSGVFVGVILSLLGVPAAAIAAEYALSEIGLRDSRPAAVARLIKSPVFANDPDGRYRVERMLGAREESMVAMLEMVERKWGGAEGYVMEMCGLSKEEVEKVREVMIVNVEEKKTDGVVGREKKTAGEGSAKGPVVGRERSRSFVARLWDTVSKGKSLKGLRGQDENA